MALFNASKLLNKKLIVVLLVSSLFSCSLFSFWHFFVSEDSDSPISILIFLASIYAFNLPIYLSNVVYKINYSLLEKLALYFLYSLLTFSLFSLLNFVFEFHFFKGSAHIYLTIYLLIIITSILYVFVQFFISKLINIYRIYIEQKSIVVLTTITSIFMLTIFILGVKPFEKTINKEWGSGKLEWTDFKGFNPIYSSYSAAILSEIHLTKVDSTNKIYAKAVQNNKLSWHKKNEINDYGLEHEQYHFNITEFFARRLNQIITLNPDYSEKDIKTKLEYLNEGLEWYQNQYDKETNHGLKYEFQDYWKYKIDSMLNSFDEPFIDYYSGISVFFPKTPHYKLSVDSFPIKQNYFLNDYEMHFGLIISHLEERISNDFDEKVINSLNKNCKISVSIHDTLLINIPSKMIFWEDPITKEKFKQALIYDSKNSLKISLLVYFPSDTKNNHVYEKMADSFLSSLNKIDLTDYWVDRDNNQFHTIEKDDDNSEYYLSDSESPSACVSHLIGSNYSAVTHPAINKNGYYYIPFKPLSHESKEIDSVYVLVDYDIYPFCFNCTNTVEHIFKINEGIINEGDKVNQIYIGYSLKKDSSDCRFLNGLPINF